MGIDIKILVGALSSYSLLVHGLPPLPVLILEVALVRREGRHRLALNMHAVRRMWVLIVAVSVVEPM